MLFVLCICRFIDDDLSICAMHLLLIIQAVTRNCSLHRYITLTQHALNGPCLGKPVSVPFPRDAVVPSCQVGNAGGPDTARVEIARAGEAISRLNKHGANPAYELRLFRIPELPRIHLRG